MCNGFHIAQNNGCKHIGRDQVAVDAGIIAGTEARPGQTHAGFYQSALAFSGQGICVIAALTLEGIRGFLLVILFGLPYVQDGVQAFYEIVIKMVCTAGVFPEQICELNGIAQRVDLVFAFPEPIAHFRLIVIPAVAVFFLVEGICIGIMVYKEKLSSGQTSQQVGNLLILCCSYQIGAHLCNGIPQPHRRDITGDNMGCAVLHLFHSCIQGVGKTVDKQFYHCRVLCKGLFHLVNQFLQGYR